jgi:hypothetical protein
MCRQQGVGILENDSDMSDTPCRDHVKGMVWQIGRGILDASMDDSCVPKRQSLHQALQKAGFLSNGFGHRDLGIWPGKRKRDGGKASARADIEEGTRRTHACHEGGKRIANMRRQHVPWVGIGGQVHYLVCLSELRQKGGDAGDGLFCFQ